MPTLLLKPVVMVVSVLVALSAAALIVGGVTQSPRPAWFIVGFDALVLSASIAGILASRGRFARAPAFAVLLVAATVAIASLAGYLGSSRQLHGRSLNLILFARLGAAGVLAAIAAASVLARNPGPAWRRLAIGGALTAVSLVCVAALYAFWASPSLSSLPSLVKVLLVLFVGGTILAGASAGVHLIIRAFEAGLAGTIPDAGKPASPPSSGA